jgi:brefeldin A-inhibited guanine nucleotide-exchange protein
MLAKRGKDQIKGNKKTHEMDLFVLVNDTEHIKTMFEDTWSANLAVFSVLLEESDEERITSLCLEGFLHAIKVCGYYRMNTERDAFVSSLSKFTQIGTLKEIKDKNLDCI